jgi:RNA 3'-terminal phosphate cyclase (ATP)
MISDPEVFLIDTEKEKVEIIPKETKNPYNLITSDETLQIDGSILEGGGQILRISVLLSILFKKALKISNIRGKRSNPGLQRQHLTGIEAACALSNSKLEGGKISSMEIVINPGSVNHISESLFKCDCNGAGSIGLLIQLLLPCLIFAKDKICLEMIGGTVVSHAPPTYYIDHVLNFFLVEKMGLNYQMEVNRHGLFPGGGGKVFLTTTPLNYIVPINITSRGKLLKVTLRIASTNNFASPEVKTDTLSKQISKNLKKSITSYLKSINPDLENNNFEVSDYLQLDTDLIQLYKSKNTLTLFAQIVLVFENTVISCEQLFSEKKEKSEINKFAEELFGKFDEILHKEKVCVDEFTVDHLIIFMALANGRSKIHLGEISKHTLTAIEIIKKFVPGVEIEILTAEDYSVIEIKGINWRNENI